MSRRSATLRGRRFARGGFRDCECEVTRVTGSVTNPDGTVTKTKTTVYSGGCEIRTNDPYEKRAGVADVETTILRDVVKIPVEGIRFKTGDEVTITTARLDPDLIGRVWRIAGPSRMTHGTARRMYIEEVTQP